MAVTLDAERPPPPESIESDANLRYGRGTMMALGGAVVLAILYFASSVLIPIALAILLSFLLSPVVRGFERLRLGRIGSVVVVVVLAFGLLGAISFGVFTQVTYLADELPNYRSNIRAKVADLQGVTSGGLIDKFTHAFEDVMAAVERGTKPRPRQLQKAEGEEPVPVVMQAPSVLWQIPTLLEGLASAGLVLVLVIFTLLERRELRDRFIRLIGHGRLAVTTRALDEAAERISRYLLAQSLINASYGVAVGVGLAALGVPYELLWGFMAALLRFIPYVGPFLGAGMPLVLSLAAFPGWSTPLLVAGLFAIVELATNLVAEPLLYGQSAGVSQVALLAAIAFWTWLWGPIGLVLATPLTVCLVVLSKHVPELRFIFYLLADEEVLEPDVRLYQRLLAADLDEAVEVVQELRAANPECNVYDDLLLPALARTRIDRETHRLSSDEELRMMRSARQLLATLNAQAEEDQAEEEEKARAAAADGGEPERVATVRIEGVLGCPAGCDADELVLQILARELARDGIALDLLWSGAGSLEVLGTVESSEPRVVCIAGLPPRGELTARYLCRRLRRQFPNLVIIVLLPGVKDGDTAVIGPLQSVGANVVVGTLRAAQEALRESLTRETTTAESAVVNA